MGAVDLIGKQALGGRAGAVSWISIRPEPVRMATFSGGRLDIFVPGSLGGIFAVMMAIGPGGAAWLSFVRKTAWFDAVRPVAGDLGYGEMDTGYWPGRAGGETAKLKVPAAPLVSVALFAGSSDGEKATALETVRERVNASGRPVRVVVTLARDTADDCRFVAGLLEAGAFVIQGGADVREGHLHSFPAYTAMIPRGGQLVGVDLNDYLQCWQPSRVGRLENVSYDLERAEPTLHRIGLQGELFAVNLNFNLDLDAPGCSLFAIDRFAELCRRLLNRPERLIFTTRKRLDGLSGLVDVLAVSS